MKNAVIIGSADCVMSDLARLNHIAGPIEAAFTTIAVNDGGVLWPGRLDHWVTLHPDELPDRIERRRKNGFPDGFTTWSNTGHVDRLIPQDYAIIGGGSAILAVSAARYLRHRSTLVGCPMDAQPYFTEHPIHGNPDVWPYFRVYQEHLPPLTRKYPWLLAEVRSMSGFTAQVFGQPDRAWLGMEDT